MKNILLLLGFISGVLSFSACSSTSSTEAEVPPPRPNIILLVGDDQGYPYFGFMGADYVQTPHMDMLAKSGVLFTQGYVPQNHCRPSLQTLMTGTLPHQYKAQVASMFEQSEGYDTILEASRQQAAQEFDFHAMKHFQTLPRILAHEGYVSFQGGKWWEFNYQNGGFDEGMTKGWTEEDKGKNDWFLKFMGGEGTELARATMQPVYDFIDQHADAPFFIWYAPELPHYPFDAPARYYDLYKEEDMSESAKRYYANCTWFDDGVGELINYLKEKGEFEQTLFVYVNDNGWEQAPQQEFRHDSLRWHNGGDKGKLSIYDMSFRTPIIFSWAGEIPANQTRTQLIHSADIPATLLNYLQIPIPEDYFGTSQMELVQEGKGAGREQIIGRVTQMRSEADMMGMKIEGYWLRNQDWFFQWNKTLELKQLFDMKQDPNNDHNLAESHPELVASFTAAIENWQEQEGL